MVIIHFQCEAGHEYALKSGLVMAEANALGSAEKAKQAAMEKDYGIVGEFSDWVTGHESESGGTCQAKVFVESVVDAD